MRTIIAGGRNISELTDICEAVNRCGFGNDISEVVSGTAPGADRLGEMWANTYGVPIKRFPAEWNGNGKAAGIIRNCEMAAYAEALIAIWDGISPGTRHMISEARRRGLRVFVYRVEQTPQYY